MKNQKPIVDFNHLEYHPLLQQLRQQISPSLEDTLLKIEWYEPQPNAKLLVRRWSHRTIPITKRIICFHGAAGDGEYYVLLADQLVKFGFEIICYDYYGHGLSDGPRGDLKSFLIHYTHATWYINRIFHENQAIPLYLFGESMGGTVMINTLIENTQLPQFAGIILFAPGVKFKTSSLSSQQVWMGIKSLFAIIFHPSWLGIKLTPNPQDNIRNGHEIMNPIHFDYDRTNPAHLAYVSPRFLLQLNKGFQRAFKYGPLSIKWTCIIFYGTNDLAIDQKGVESFFNRIPVEKKQLQIVQKAPHAMFTHSVFQPYWNTLLEWLKKSEEK